MKIAIQGHPTRGKEVIQILESLGGKSRGDLTGRRYPQYYFINSNGDIDLHYRSNLFTYKLYTLEEFEKEFPFKIGDKVTVIGTKHPKIITGITDTQWEPRYVISEIKFPDSKEMPHISQISLYKKMKEERNITLTLDKAKEWYNKGGELKEIALQAFSEKELNPLPKSWEEYCRKYESCCFSTRYTNIPLKYDALIKLEQLRDCWRQGWEPNCNDDKQAKCCIVHSQEFKIHILYETRRFLSFPTTEMAKEFLECFRDLIEKAKDLI